MSTQLLCNTCSKPITSEYVNLGEDRNYHPDCFNCSICKKSLAGEQYYEMDNELYCESDYHKKFSPTCGGCHQIITDEYMEVMGINYHKNCFVCHSCKKPFGETQYYKYNGEPYCHGCYGKKASQCHSCGKPILDKTYSALNKTYHLDCFVCGVCGKHFEAGAFVPHEDRPYHQDCYKTKYGKKCSICNEHISGEYYDIDGACIHKDCFEKYKALSADEKKKLTAAHQETPQATTTTTTTTLTKEEPKKEEPKKEEPKKEEPKKEEPKKEEPVKQDSKPEETKLEAPKLDAPKLEAPKLDAPKLDLLAPKLEPPKLNLMPAPKLNLTATASTKSKPEEKKEPSAGIKVEANLVTLEPILKTTVVAPQKIEEGVKTDSKQESASGTIYPYELLTKPPFPKGVDPTKRENYLTFAEFERLFKMTWQEWEGLSKWKQNDAKKKLKLF